MAWPSFPAAEVTSAEQSLLQICSGFARFLETWNTVLGLCSLADPAERPAQVRLGVHALVGTTWAEQHKPGPAQARGVVVPALMP